MRKSPLAVSTFRLKNFKAVRDSGTIRFTPLTVFIGNNGVGKSSIVEGLETLKSIATDGLDKAMQRWRGFDYIWNQAIPHTLITRNNEQYYSNPMAFEVSGIDTDRTYRFDAIGIKFHASSVISKRPGKVSQQVFFLQEDVQQFLPGHPKIQRTRSAAEEGEGRYTPDDSSLPLRSLMDWQFVRLNPEQMTQEKPLRSVAGSVPLAEDGSNIAQYLWDIQQQDASVLPGIVETMQTVLPYLVEMQPTLTSEIGRSIYLQFQEEQFKIPSWLFSTGTLRVIALLALFRHPNPPPLIVIEELENGLDPRTLSLIIEEIRHVVTTGRSQVIITTHSPYLLDLVPLSSLIFVERMDGQPAFTRPGSDESVQRWSQDFAPGKLYTMGRFRHSK